MRHHFLTFLLCTILISACTGPEASSGSGQVLGGRPTSTPTRTPTPTRTQAPTETPIPPTVTSTPTVAVGVGVFSATVEVVATVDAPTETPYPTVPYSVETYDSEFLQLKFDLPETWSIDDNFEEQGVLQIADTAETLYSGSVRRGALITIIGLERRTENLTDWLTLVTSTFDENFLADDGQTTLFRPVSINGYEGLRLEQRGSYTVVDPPEPVTLKVIALEQNGWVVTMATGTINDGLNRGADEFEWLIRSVEITAPPPAEN